VGYHDRVRTIVIGLTYLCLVTSEAAAQVVRGVVTEEGIGTRLAGAMVILMDVDGTPVDRVLTDASGQFIADVDHPGRYQIRIDRIGYASLTTSPFDVPVSGTFQSIDVPIEPVRLRGLDVEGSRRCEVRPEEGRVTARVWAEAKKALEAAAWTQSSGLYRYTLLHYVRDRDRNGQEIVEEKRRFMKGSTQAPFVSLPAEELAELGYIRQEPDSGTAYHAPDAEALLSDSFLDTHCLGVTRGDEGTIGLRFEPIEGRVLPDIKGVLWLDEETARLERLDFDYVNLRRSREIGKPGGQVVFGGLPDGTWIVREWWIRMPLLAVDLRRGIRRVGYRDEGGLAWRISNQKGEIVLEATTATISGVVADSIKLDGVQGVDVEVSATGERYRTRADGSFLVPGLPEGLHTLRVRHPLLDTLGVAAPAVQVEAALGEIVHAWLQVPGLGEALAAACGGDPRPDRTAVLLGRLIGPDGRPAGGARARLSWITGAGFVPQMLAVPLGPDGEQPLEWILRAEAGRTVLQTVTDGRGIFVLCDVPSGSRLRVDAWLEGGDRKSRRAFVPRSGDVAVVTIQFEEGGER